MSAIFGYILEFFFCSNREYTIFQISLEPGNILLFFPFFFSFLHLMRSCSYTCPGTNSMTHHVLSNGPSRPLPIDTGHDHLYSLLFSYLVFITIDKLLNGDWLSSKAWDCANGHSVCLLLCGASCFLFQAEDFFCFCNTYKTFHQPFSLPFSQVTHNM